MLTIAQVAAQLQVSAHTIRREIADGRLAVISNAAVRAARWLLENT